MAADRATDDRARAVSGERAAIPAHHHFRTMGCSCSTIDAPTEEAQEPTVFSGAGSLEVVVSWWVRGHDPPNSRCARVRVGPSWLGFEPVGLVPCLSAPGPAASADRPSGWLMVCGRCAT